MKDYLYTDSRNWLKYPCRHGTGAGVGYESNMMKSYQTPNPKSSLKYESPPQKKKKMRRKSRARERIVLGQVEEGTMDGGGRPVRSIFGN